MRKWIVTAALLLAALWMPLQAQNMTEEEVEKVYGSQLLKPGTPAPDFTLNDINGKPVSLKDFRGKYVVLIFWATWCPDCRAEQPFVRALRANTSPAVVEFVSVSFDRSLDKLRQYAKSNKLVGYQLFDPAGKKDSQVGQAYHAYWIPTSYLIDREGKIAMATVLFEKMEATVKRLH